MKGEGLEGLFLTAGAADFSALEQVKRSAGDEIHVRKIRHRHQRGGLCLASPAIALLPIVLNIGLQAIEAPGQPAAGTSGFLATDRAKLVIGPHIRLP